MTITEGKNAIYAILAGAGAMGLGIVLPWVHMNLGFTATTFSGFDLEAKWLGLVVLAIAGCGVLFLNGRRDPWLKPALAVLASISVLFMALEAVRLTASFAQANSQWGGAGLIGFDFGFFLTALGAALVASITVAVLKKS